MSRTIRVHLARLWREQRGVQGAAAAVYLLIALGVTVLVPGGWMRDPGLLLGLCVTPFALAILIDIDHLAGERRSPSFGLQRRLPGGLLAGALARLGHAAWVGTGALLFGLVTTSLVHAYLAPSGSPAPLAVLTSFPGDLFTNASVVVLWGYGAALCTGSGILAIPLSTMLVGVLAWPLWSNALLNFDLGERARGLALGGAVLGGAFFLGWAQVCVRRYLSEHARLWKHALPVLALATVPSWIHAGKRIRQEVGEPRTYHAVYGGFLERGQRYAFFDAYGGIEADEPEPHDVRAMMLDLHTLELQDFGPGSTWAYMGELSRRELLKGVQQAALTQGSVLRWREERLSWVLPGGAQETRLPWERVAEIAGVVDEPPRHPSATSRSTRGSGGLWHAGELAGEEWTTEGVFASDSGPFWSWEALGRPWSVSTGGGVWVVRLDPFYCMAFDPSTGEFDDTRALTGLEAWGGVMPDGRCFPLGPERVLFDWRDGSRVRLHGFRGGDSIHPVALAGMGHGPPAPLLVRDNLSDRDPTIYCIEPDGLAVPVHEAADTWWVIGYPDERSLVAIEGHERLVRFDWISGEVTVLFPRSSEVAP